MNLSWVLLLTIAVIVEKTLPAGDLISKIIGVVLIVGAALMTYDVIYGQSMPMQFHHIWVTYISIVIIIYHILHDMMYKTSVMNDTPSL